MGSDVSAGVEPSAGSSELPPRDEVTVRIEAPAEQLWDMVADITRMGEWSPECYRCRWIGRERRPVAGARFIGFNKMGFRRWATPNVVLEAERGRVFSFQTMGNRSIWGYRFEPVGSADEDGGEATTVTEFRQPPAKRPWYARAALQLIGGQAYDDAVTKGMQATLTRLKTTAEA